MKVQQLDLTLLQAIARVTLDDWLPCSLGDLRNRMLESNPGVANVSNNSIVETIIVLANEQYLWLRKRDDGEKPSPFDFQKQRDEGYRANFFYRNGFEMKLTGDGGNGLVRKRRNHQSKLSSSNQHYMVRITMISSKG